MISVLLVDDHDLIRGGLRRAFEEDGAFDVVGEASTVSEAMALVTRQAPDVVVFDVNLPDGNGLDAVRLLRAERPELGIVVLTMYDDDAHLFAALEAQASAFVVKSAPTDAVLSAAKHAAAAPLAFSAADLAGAMRRRMAGPAVSLTPREQQVLDLLASGMTVAALAKRLYISESTAKTYAAKLYEKLGATNRSQALVAAARLGLLEAPARP